VHSWVAWTEEGNLPERAPHREHIRVYGSYEIARSLMRRTYSTTNGDLNTAYEFLRWCMSLAAANIGNHLDTDRIPMLILDPEYHIHSTYDRPATFGELMDAQDKKDGPAEPATAATSASAASPAPAPAPTPTPASASASGPSGDIESGLYDDWSAENLRKGDACDIQLEDGSWVMAQVEQLSDTETEIEFEVLTTLVKVWLSIEVHASRMAPYGTKSLSAGAAGGLAPASGPPLTTDPEELAWRRTLTVGSLLDVREKAAEASPGKRWYIAVVVEAKPLDEGAPGLGDIKVSVGCRGRCSHGPSPAVALSQPKFALPASQPILHPPSSPLPRLTCWAGRRRRISGCHGLPPTSRAHACGLAGGRAPR